MLLLSATLGEAMRARLLGQSRRSIEEASAIPYPAVAAGDDVRSVEATSRKHVAIAALPHRECAQQVLEAAENGASVLWLRSTVADAIEDYRALHESGVPTVLHHSRWADPTLHKYPRSRGMRAQLRRLLKAPRWDSREKNRLGLL